MNPTIRPIACAVVLLAFSAWPCPARLAAAQEGVATAPSPPAFSDEEMERFLLNANVTATIKVSKGVTQARQVRMSDGKLTHDAQVQDVDIALPIFNVDPKHTEVNFKDSYRYNVAAYRLSRLLGLDNVPISVEREIDHKPAAVTWWLDNVMMEEGDRLKIIKGKGSEKDKDGRPKSPYGPSPSRTVGYLSIMRVFDELIQNRDRNEGNMLWTKDWKLWMIDHTRAFRLGKELLVPKSIASCERSLFEKMKMLDGPKLTQVMGKTLTREEIDALLARRDALVKLLDAKIAESGEAKILFTLPKAS